MAIYGIRASVTGPHTNVVLVDDGVTLVAGIDTAIDALQAAELATLATAMGVLVADGATPTQAHVNTANSALTALTDAIAALQTNQTTAASAAVSGDVVIYVDASAVTANELRAAFEAIYNDLVRSRRVLSLA